MNLELTRKARILAPRAARVFSTHSNFLAVLASGAFVWVLVFMEAVTTFGGTQPLRAVWSGSGAFNIMGYTIPYFMEGWADYDYYYVSWADQFLMGRMPYTDAFNIFQYDGVDYRTPYFFPPLYVYLCVIGRLLPVQPFGIGLIISLLGFLTVFPVHGIAHYLSGNRAVADIASVTYLFNPLVLYHTTFEWLNPSPFVFFGMLSMWLLMTGHRDTGALSMVTAALFKQTAFFLLLPMIAYLIKRAPGAPVNTNRPRSKGLPSDRLDLRGFARTAALSGIYAAAISMPYLLDPGAYLSQILLRVGSVNLERFDVVPAGNAPISLAVPFIALGAPEWFSIAVNFFCFSTIGLMVGVLPPLAFMLFKVKDDTNLPGYWRRILYYTFIMMICVHLFSPRGDYKYYFVALIPFLSILATPGMLSETSNRVKASVGMMVFPFLWTLLILLPDRNIYLISVLALLVVYMLLSGLTYSQSKSQPHAAVSPDKTMEEASSPSPLSSSPPASSD